MGWVGALEVDKGFDAFAPLNELRWDEPGQSGTSSARGLIQYGLRVVGRIAAPCHDLVGADQHEAGFVEIAQ